MSIAEARRAVQICQRHLAHERLGERDYWSGKDGNPGGPALPLLLQAFDELTVAYKDRSALFDPPLPKDAAVIALGPTIVVDGRIVGVWKRSLKGDTVSVQLRLFKKLGKGHRSSLIAAARDYGRFLGKKVSEPWSISGHGLP